MIPLLTSAVFWVGTRVLLRILRQSFRNSSVLTQRRKRASLEGLSVLTTLTSPRVELINDVEYVLDDSSQATLKRVSPDAGLLAQNNELVTVPDFSTRHLALSAVGESSGPTYDISGIPAYKTVTLSYVTNSDESSYEDETYDFGSEVSLNKLPLRSGYTFAGWYLDEALSSPCVSYRI